MTMHLEAPFEMDAWDATPDGATPDGAPETARGRPAQDLHRPVLVATATGQALTTQGPGGASYVAQERIVGTLDGRQGSFVLEHRASTGDGHPTVMDAMVVPGSGTAELAGLVGTGRVAHGLLTLDVRLPDG